MKITIEPTTELVFVNGAGARFWTGTTDQGTPVHAVVFLVAAPPGTPQATIDQLQRELVEQEPRIIVDGELGG